jgi:uncharacterized phiE125 gp8 family phage protein
MINPEVRIDTESNTDAVTAADVKAWGKIPGTADDIVIGNMIKACRQLQEQWTGRSYIEKTLTANYAFLESYKIELPMGPVRSIESIKRVYEGGTLSDALEEGTDYYISGMDFKVVNLYQRWSTAGSTTTGLRIAYTVGHSTDGAASTVKLPDPLRQALLRHITADYDMRDDLEVYNPVLYDWTKEAINPYKVANLWL